MDLLVIEEADVALQEKLGEGSFGLVRLGLSRSTKEKLAIKLEPQSLAKPLLEHEAHVMKKLHRKQGIPLVYSYGCTQGWNYMVMQLLGNSLNYKWQICGDKFSLSTLLACAEQMAIALSAVHNANYVHRDIKPQNFLVGRGVLSTAVFLIDFGLAKKFNERSAVSAYKSDKVTGTMPFVSLNVHSGLNPSMRDDLESLAYVLLYFLNGGLPWYAPGLDLRDEREVRRIKEQLDPVALCAGLPQEFGLLLKYARQLRFEEQPDYGFVLSLFRSVAARMSLSLVVVPDWQTDKGKGRRKTQSGEFGCASEDMRKKKVRKARASLRVEEDEQTKELDMRRVHSLIRESSMMRSKTQEKLFTGFQGKRIEIMQKMPSQRLSRETTRASIELHTQQSLKPQQPNIEKCALF